MAPKVDEDVTTLYAEWSAQKPVQGSIRPDPKGNKHIIIIIIIIMCIIIIIIVIIIIMSEVLAG